MNNFLFLILIIFISSCGNTVVPNNKINVLFEEIELIEPEIRTYQIENPAQYNTRTKTVLDSITGEIHEVVIRSIDVPLTYRTIVDTIKNKKIRIKYPNYLVPKHPSHTIDITIFNEINKIDTVECLLWDSSKSTIISQEEISAVQTVVRENTWIWKVFLPKRSLKYVDLSYKIEGKNLRAIRKNLKIKVIPIKFSQKVLNYCTINNLLILITLVSFVYAIYNGRISLNSFLGAFTKNHEINGNNEKEK